MKLYHVFGEDTDHYDEGEDRSMIVAANDPDEAFRLWAEFWGDDAETHEMDVTDYAFVCYQGMRELAVPAEAQVMAWTTDSMLVPRIVAIKTAEKALEVA